MANVRPAAQLGPPAARRGPPAAAVASGALALGFPEGASLEQEALHGFFLLATAGALLLVLAVFVATLVLARRPRHAPPLSEPAPAPSRRARYALVAVFILVPAIVIGALGALSDGLTLEMERAPPEGAFRVEVVGAQFNWTFVYPDGSSTVNRLHIPANETVALALRSEDVIHSFFVPDLGFKMDAVPGTVNVRAVRAVAPGEYPSACAEYCGVGHAKMRAVVVVHPEGARPPW